MQISLELVQKIARLARLTLSPDEEKLYAQQLSDILGYVEKLNELDTADVPETNQVTGLTNSLREDSVQPFGHETALIATSQNPIRDGQIQVQKSL